MKKINLVFLTKEMSLNGISNVIMNYSNKIDKNKYDVTILSGPSISNYYIEEAKNNNYKIIETPSKRGKNPLKYYLFLYRYLKQNHVDIFHIHGNSATILIEIVIAWLCRIKIRISHCHNTTCDYKIINYIFRPFLNVFSTEKMACSKDASIWMFNKETNIIPNGFEIKKYYFNSLERKKIRTKLNISDKTLVIGHVGKFNDQKNHIYLLNVFKEILKKREECKLLLIGSGEKMNKIKKCAIDNGIYDKIIFLDEICEPYPYYSAMDVFCFPSRFEGLGIVLLEAQINGLPCIVSDKIPKEAMLSNKMCFLPLNEEYNVWSQRIIESKRDYDITSCKKEKLNKYDIDKNVIQLCKIYEKLLEK